MEGDKVHRYCGVYTCKPPQMTQWQDGLLSLKHHLEVGSLPEVLIETPGSYVRVTDLLQDVPLPMQKLTLGLAGLGASALELTSQGLSYLN